MRQSVAATAIECRAMRESSSLPREDECSSHDQQRDWQKFGDRTAREQCDREENGEACVQLINCEPVVVRQSARTPNIQNPRTRDGKAGEDQENPGPFRQRVP